MHRDPRPAGKSADGPEKSRSGGVSTRCHAKVPPKDRIFGRGRDSRHGSGSLTCGFPDPAARSIRPIDENPILWRDFCSGAGRPRHSRTDGLANRSQTWRMRAQTCQVPRNGGTRQVCARTRQDYAPFHEHSAFFERLRATCTRSAPCTRPTRDAFLCHTPMPHTTQNIPGRKQKRAGSATLCRPSMAGDNPRPMTTPS